MRGNCERCDVHHPDFADSASEHLAFVLLILVKALPKVAIFMRPLEQSISPWAIRFSTTSHSFC
jgi:hypothetical protein